MNVTLKDYENNSREFDIGKKEDILFAVVQKLSGDEVLEVTYKEGSETYKERGLIDRFDPSNSRYMNLDDGWYIAFNSINGFNIFEEPWWKERECDDFPPGDLIEKAYKNWKENEE